MIRNGEFPLFYLDRVLNPAHCIASRPKEVRMGRTNYSFKKRQKEMERKQKQEEKRQRRLLKNSGVATEDASSRDGAGEGGAETDLSTDLP